MLTEFAYVGLDPAGKQGRGHIAAVDRREALASLRARGLTVIDLKEETARKGFAGRRRMNRQDMYYLARELATLLRSGVQVDKAVEILAHSAVKQDVQDLLTFILGQIREGKSVASAFEETGRFDSFIAMIRNNEEIGRLPEAFENIAGYLQFQIQFRGEIRDAMTYPAFLIFTSLVTLFVIFQFIVPRFLGIFGASADHLPAAAKFLFALSRILSLQNVLIGTAVLAGGAVLAAMSPAKRHLPALQEKLLQLPVVGGLVLNLDLSRFSYSMHALLDSGVEFIKALRLSTALVRNAGLKRGLEEAAVRIREGQRIADAFAHISFLPPTVQNMIRIGEESGSLRDIFLEVYRIFEEKFKAAVKRIMTLLEPAIIILMGLVVGFIVLTLIQTVMSVGSIKL